MTWFGRVDERLASLEEAMALVEKEAGAARAVRQARSARREFWLAKLIPAGSATVIAVLGVNTLTHWF